MFFFVYYHLEISEIITRNTAAHRFLLLVYRLLKLYIEKIYVFFWDRIVKSQESRNVAKVLIYIDLSTALYYTYIYRVEEWAPL